MSRLFPVSICPHILRERCRTLGYFVDMTSSGSSACEVFYIFRLLCACFCFVSFLFCSMFFELTYSHYVLYLRAFFVAWEQA